MPSYPYTKITSRNAVIGKAFGGGVDDGMGVLEDCVLLENVFLCGFLRP